ncbi:hypothetical protein HZS_3792 [Henneguya salminicola]|nr:hypothetical protein HZS_3792 [Henneguya salminicola]
MENIQIVYMAMFLHFGPVSCNHDYFNGLGIHIHPVISWKINVDPDSDGTHSVFNGYTNNFRS